MIDKMIRIGNLFDLYGGLLTPKQIQMIKLYFFNDLSLSEIAEQFSVTRQAVRDVLVRAEQLLEGYEERLKLYEKFSNSQKNIEELLIYLNSIKENINNEDSLSSNIDRIDNAIELAKLVRDNLG
jgi:predicted DNA-binding protein YlxM (UPF0122 family)